MYFSEDTLLFWVVNFQCVTYATCVGLKKEKKTSSILWMKHIYTARLHCFFANSRTAITAQFRNQYIVATVIESFYATVNLFC